MTSELARLGASPKLKQLHITFEADDYSGTPEWEEATVEEEVDHVLDVLEGVECHAAVTAAIHPTLGKTDFNLPTYLDTLVKLQW